MPVAGRSCLTGARSRSPSPRSRWHRARRPREPGWRLEQPDPPPGDQFRTPLGPPGDLQFWSRNRGLLGVEGNAAIPRGLYRWNGERVAQLATVCGGPGDTTADRLGGADGVLDGERAEPAARAGRGLTLCRFKDGEVVASYSTPRPVAPTRTAR